MSERRPAPTTAGDPLDLEAVAALSSALLRAGPTGAPGTGSSGAGARAARRARGVVYTPAPLVDFVVAQTLAPWAGRALDQLSVLDPACGDGRFLTAAAAWCRRQQPRAQLRLVGIERDGAVAAATRLALTGQADIVQLHEGEALLGEHLDAPVDAVLGNPPYVRSIHLRAHDPALWQALRQRFAATSHGEWDLYAAFIERSLTWVRPGGRVGLVVPSRWLTAAFAAPLRGRIAREVVSVIDFGAQQVFPDATTYASVLVLERARAARAATFVRHTDRGWQREELQLPERDGAPWILRAATPGQTLAGGGGTLGELAQLVKGCGTNADKVFVIRGTCGPDALVGRNGLGQQVEVEARAVRPCLRGRDIKAAGKPGAKPGAEPTADPAAPRDFCVLPYRLTQAQGLAGLELWPWPELSRQLPAAAAYLEAHRAALEARERGRFTGAQFHRFGRPQNLSFLLDAAPKLVVPDVTIGGRARIDRGSLVLDSAYALRPRATAPAPWTSLPLWAALLGSPAVRLWLDMVGVSLRGNYVRMKTAFLSPMPLPPDGPALRRAAQAADAGESALTSEALREAYGIAHSTWASALPA